MDKPTTLMPDTLRENENSALLILSPENRRYLTGMKTSFGAVLTKYGFLQIFAMPFRLNPYLRKKAFILLKQTV